MSEALHAKKEQAIATGENGVRLWSQLPKSGDRCQASGLSRSAINALILPTKANGFKPPVKSRSIKSHKHASRGIRLYSVESLLAYIEAQEA
jgi:hypothetical protein